LTLGTGAQPVHAEDDEEVEVIAAGDQVQVYAIRGSRPARRGFVMSIQGFEGAPGGTIVIVRWNDGGRLGWIPPGPEIELVELDSTN
jgi:hypothetical protein